jgi:hypothetical protein
MVAPEAPSMECTVKDISDSGICIDVGAIALPKIFAVSFTADARVFRLCELVWRRGSTVGAHFITADDVRRKMSGLNPRLN